MSIKVILTLISERAQIRKYVLVWKIFNALLYNGLISVKESTKDNLET